MNATDPALEPRAAMAAEVIVRTYLGDNQWQVVFGIGIVLLVIFAFYKLVRTLIVTYHRPERAPSA